jgi:hypothetical protein
MLKSSFSIQRSAFSSSVFLNEFLGRVKNLFGARDGLLRNAGRNATDALGDGLCALANSGCCAAHGLATRQRDLATALLFRRGSALGLASAALAGWTLAGALPGWALSGSALASNALASGAFSAFRLARR